MRGLHRSVDIMCSGSGCLARFHLFSFSFISFLPVGGLGVASGGRGGGLRSFCCCRSYFSRSRPLGWAALALQRAAPKVCVLSCRVYCDLEESSIFLRLT